MTKDELNTILNSWPEGCNGHEQDRALIEQLDDLGSAAGYGWLAQLAQYLYEIQCHGTPDRAAAMKRSRFGSLGWQLPADFDEVARRSTP